MQFNYYNSRGGFFSNVPPATKYRIRNFFVPIVLSTGEPNVYSANILKKRCQMPPCINIWVKICHQWK